ncbi:hypothetical protein NDU88_004339 [Pleurodeles waltl]|uniref:Uncharacterized protein n=1 Tax=Pleurodeles waltl TaxID=8319 RepID=A0AAV7MT71_PLEWA|nr:hypothetical protein NDU88_004339 [Pleurodeles waltl]
MERTGGRLGRIGWRWMRELCCPADEDKNKHTWLNRLIIGDERRCRTEKLSLARDVELLGKPLDGSTMVKHETKNKIRKTSPRDVDLLGKALDGSTMVKHETKDVMRKTLLRNKMLPSKYRDYVLFV